MNRAELVTTLELIRPALATSIMVPIFQCFIFSKDTISAYNDSIAIVGPANVDFEEPCAIHGTTLLGLLSNSRADEVGFKFTDAAVTIKCGKTVSKLPYQSEDSFIFKIPNERPSWEIPFTIGLFEAMKLCLETVSKDETQMALQGVTVDGDKMYSSDSDSLTRVQLKNTPKGNRVLLSTAFCSAVAKLWSSISVTNGTLSVSDEWVVADFCEWSIYGRILEIQDKIDFEGLIKKTTKAKATTQALPDGFSDALSRARVLADPESQKTNILIVGGKLHMLTETHMGEINDTLPFKDHPEIEVNVNAALLQSAIKNCDQITFLENCTLLEKTPDILMLVSNMG